MSDPRPDPSAPPPDEPSPPTGETSPPPTDDSPANDAAVPDGDGSPPPEDFDGPFERVTPRRRWPVVAIGLAVVAALVGSTVLVRSASSGDDPDDGGGAEAPPPTTTPEPATEAEVEAVVAEISEFVAQARGVEFLEPVTVELEAEGDFQDRLLADFDEDAEDLRHTEVFLEGLGLVEPEVDLVEAMRALLGGGVVGFYDPETAEMVVRGAALTPYVRTTIAHELTHALDDQHHDLDRPQYDDADDETSFGFSAVAEGNARRIEGAYRDSLTDDERDQATEEEMALGGDIDLASIPLILVDLIGAPYTLGEPFVDELLAAGGDPALTAAFVTPPSTTEQVLDPARYLAGEAAIDVPVPQVAGEVVDEGAVGQLMVLLVLADQLGIDEAREAATGWGGDWGVAWRDGERSCVTATLVGDDVAETEQMRQSFERWAEAHEGAQVVPTGAGGPFTLESCSA
jgi:hypothetical protein